MAKEMTEFNNRLDKLAEYCMNSGRFDQDLYIEYDVKRGLRDSNGKGILTGLTEISDVVAFKSVHGRKIPIDGQLYYQGYNVMNLVEGNKTSRFGFEEITFSSASCRTRTSFRNFLIFLEIIVNSRTTSSVTSS